MSSVTVQWQGEEDVRIYGHTNPWLRDNASVDVNLMELIEQGRGSYLDEDDPAWCDQCGMFPGVIGAMDTDDGIQCCDQCRRYDSDLTAAQVLAGYLAEILPERAPFTVWFEKDTTPEVHYDCRVHGPDCYGCVYEVAYTKE